MRDVVIPYNTMSYDTVKPPSNGWLPRPNSIFIIPGAARRHNRQGRNHGKREQKPTHGEISSKLCRPMTWKAKMLTWGHGLAVVAYSEGKPLYVTFLSPPRRG